MTLNYFFTRKLSFVKEAHAFALFPGGFGTMDEAFEVLTLMQIGKRALSRSCYWTGHADNIGKHGCNFLPTACLNAVSFRRDFAFFKIKHNAQDAAAEITQFYEVFHSARWVGERFVIRLNRSLSNQALGDLDNHFADILRTGEIVQRVAFPKENDDLETLDLPRLIFTPVHSAINSSPRA